MTDVPGLLRERRPSQVGLATSIPKLNGRIYTPPAVASRLFDLLPWPPGPLLDPACGDGVFLAEALRRIARLAPGRAADCPITGWDVDEEALALARARLAVVAAETGLPAPVLYQRDALDPGEEGRFACVVGNPPYLEAKRMPASLQARIRAACPVAARGAFDLYGAFVERAHALVGPGGAFGFVLPDRFLVTAYAEGLRRLLLEDGSIRVVDLTREAVFEDAAVYPVLLAVVRSGAPRYRVEDPSGAGADLPVDVLSGPLDGLMPLPDPSVGRLLARVLADRRLVPLGSVVRPRWCVSFHRAGLRDRYTFDHRPNTPFARPFLGGGRFAGNREVEPFRIAWAGGWIDYDEARARADRNPLPAAEQFQPPQVVICQNARRSRAALDAQGFVLKDTFLSLRCLRRVDAALGWPEWVTILLNSACCHVIYEALYGGTRKAGGFLHFLPRYLDPFPVPPPPPGARAFHDRLAAAARQGATTLAALEAETVVRTAWGVTPDESVLLDARPVPEP
ncbi:MAG: N-6 DNA methylase [Deltaproteobacteria bacterium]|nr:N-6 DNA methylase [Deltaproteobacteria bacterium]